MWKNNNNNKILNKNEQSVKKSTNARVLENNNYDIPRKKLAMKSVQ